jgi:RND family efflux transporter MFP subunit
MQINTLKVAVSVSEKYFPVVKNGMQANIMVDMYPEKVYPGKVSLVYPAIDPATRTFTMEITIPNPIGELRPGMFSRTELSFGIRQGIMVEDVAVQRQLGTNDKYLFVDVDGVAQRRLVTTGVQEGSRINILSGVESGDKVIVAGISRLMDGTQVEEQ